MQSERSFQNHPLRQGPVDSEEDRAWAGFYKNVGRSAVLAAEVMAQLDNEAEIRRRHLALYLMCRLSLRAHKARLARRRRILQRLRWLAHGILLRPLSRAVGLARRMMRRGAQHLAGTTTPGPRAAPAPSVPGSAPPSRRRAPPETERTCGTPATAAAADTRAASENLRGHLPRGVNGHGPEPEVEGAAPRAPASRH